MTEIIGYISNYITNLVYEFGYWGIIFAMALESSLFPLPSEIVMIPAGALSKAEKMHPFLAILSGTLGSYIGSAINYLVADFLGRPLVAKYGRYFFLNETKLHKIETFFSKYGSISIFIGRLLPVVRHFISIPAGFAKMNFYLFTLYTLLGSFIWMSILVAFGYFIGDGHGKINFAMPIIKNLIIASVAIFLVYIMYKKIRNNKNNGQ